MEAAEQIELVEALGHQITIEFTQNRVGEWVPGVLIFGVRLAIPPVTFRKQENARQYALGLVKAKIIGGIWRQ